MTNIPQKMTFFLKKDYGSGTVVTSQVPHRPSQGARDGTLHQTSAGLLPPCVETVQKMGFFVTQKADLGP